MSDEMISMMPVAPIAIPDPYATKEDDGSIVLHWDERLHAFSVAREVMVGLVDQANALRAERDQAIAWAVRLEQELAHAEGRDDTAT